VDIELRHLRYFTAVADSAGFSAAARRLHVAQQVLSAQIRQLEEALGVVLFERSSRGVRLTAPGEVFLVEVRELLESLEHAVAVARKMARAGSARLAVGLSVAAGGDVPSRVLAAFVAHCPEVEVTVSTYDLDQPAAGLLGSQTDVAFVRMPVSAAGLEFRELAREPRVFVVADGNELAARPSAAWADVIGQPWVAAQVAVDGCSPAAWRDDWLVDPRPDGSEAIVGAVARTIDEWREYVVAGRGISLCPASATGHYARPGLAFVTAPQAPPAVLCLAWRSGETNPLLSAFVEVAERTCAPVAEDDVPGASNRGERQG
jgi:DNA-binding transcriptional LysR family regulator